GHKKAQKAQEITKPFVPFCGDFPGNFRARLGQDERDELSRNVTTTDRDNKILLAVATYLFSLFSAKATSALSAPAPVAITMNCRPERVRYVIGTALFGYGTFPRQISFPVFLSKA